MRPASKFHAFHEHSKKIEINGPRPSPLMINKDSHLIRKPSSSSTSIVNALTKPHKQQRKPIIIYTHSPKIIHTKPRDFMALVQRLTGMAHSKEEVFHATALPVQHQPQLEASENFGSSLSDGSNSSIKQQEKEQKWKHGSWGGDETSSSLRDVETCVKEEPYVQHSHSIMGFADMPLFTPNSSDFVCSSLSVYKYSNSPNGILGSLLSPSGLEFMKELPEY
ncbi:VQ motif-containing protein 8, chloroplastic-like [Gastrolobium bilobum]|uniref:VQ motif-containing protein 8, chloroplastic-like n=1 Tax=Gastrolobium bilobum TaxID=150636 RepID=UPI002AB2CACD|nr:VQ motif-containing protein 8, chloroplastic-like [Gastrolobium bilobum]